MSVELVERKVVEYLQRVLVRGANVTSDTQLLAAGLLDSMGLTHLVAFIEQTFAVKVEDSALEAQNFRTPNAIARFVCAALAAPSSQPS